MSDLTSAGGSLSFVILGLGFVALLILLGLGGLAATKRRVPLAALVLAPLFICVVGALGGWFSASTSLAGIGAAEPDGIVAAAAQGAFEAIQTDWFSRWVASFLFGVGAWAAGIGAFMAGPWARFTPMAAIGSAILTLAGAGVIGAYAGNYGIDGTPLIALLLFSGFGVAFSALRRATYEEAHRVAGMRFASAMCMLLAISYGSRAVTQGVRMETFGPGGIAEQADSLAAAIGMWGDIAAPAITISWIAFGFAILIAFAGFYYELGDVVEKYTLIDVGITLLLLGGLGLVRFVEDWQIDNLQAIETSAPAAAMFDDIGPDLTASLVELEDKVVNVRPTTGGFGDILQMAENNGEITWTRVQKWTGSAWEEDATPLEQVSDLSSLRPLLVMEKGMSAGSIPELLEKVGGKALLLLRAEEVKAGTEIPPELAYLQVTFLPLDLDERDLSTQMWAMAGDVETNIGASTWFGYEEDDVPVVYMTAALAETESPGLQVVINDSARTVDLTRTCLPAMFDKLDEEEAVEKAETWCRFSGATRDEVVKEAIEARDAVAPERFNARIGPIPALASAGIGADHVKARIPHEYAAIDYCLGQMVDEGEEVNGPLQLDITLSRKGKVSTKLNERSKNTNDMAVRCVKDRLAKIQFEVDDEAWTEAPEGKTNPEQLFSLLLDIRA